MQDFTGDFSRGIGIGVYRGQLSPRKSKVHPKGVETSTLLIVIILLSIGYFYSIAVARL
jgi:hypothetical protein